jgi:hypothetical protein
MFLLLQVIILGMKVQNHYQNVSNQIRFFEIWILAVSCINLIWNGNVLIITDNSIRNEGARLFSEHLKSNSFLQDLNLSGKLHHFNMKWIFSNYYR